MNCPSCNNENAPDDEFCINCGTELSANVLQSGDSVAETIPDALTSQPMDAGALEELKFYTTPRVPISVQSGGVTHVGLVKDNNEDVYLVEQVYYPAHKIQVHTLIVADGMGSPPAGEVFAHIAVHETWLGLRFLLPDFEQQDAFDKLSFWQFLNAQLDKYLTAQVASANNRVVRCVRAKKLEEGECGSTIVVAVAVCDLETGHVRIHGYNEGDARAALVVGEKLTQLSHDHTIAGAPNRFLGRRDQIGGSSFTWEAWLGEANFTSFWMLLYSDGLWNMLSPETLVQHCTALEEPPQLCASLLDDALNIEVPYGREQDERVRTGDDNITITGLRVHIPETEATKKNHDSTEPTSSHDSAVPSDGASGQTGSANDVSPDGNDGDGLSGTGN